MTDETNKIVIDAMAGRIAMLTEALEAMVRQHVPVMMRDGVEEYDSSFITGNSEGLRALAAVGRMRITFDDWGRSVQAEFVEAVDKGNNG